MKDSSIDRNFGRQAFGSDPRGYHAARPAYPAWVFEVLCQGCGLAPNAATFEVGPGTGIATRRLLELGGSRGDNPARHGREFEPNRDLGYPSGSVLTVKVL
jgi:hypothetical protein